MPDSPHAIFDMQHAGKPSRPNDRGAQADLDGDGEIEIWEREAELTPSYASAGSRELARRGHRSAFITDGPYSERHRTAGKLAESVGGRFAYVACHLNAGGGDYGLVAYDHRSSLGCELAHSIAAELEEMCPPLSRVMVVDSGRDSWSNAYSCIRGIYQIQAPIAGVCFEPCFMDNRSHAELLTIEGLRLVGDALARGIINWKD